MQSGDSSASQKAASPGGEACSHPRRSVSQSSEAYKACKPTSLQVYSVHAFQMLVRSMPLPPRGTFDSSATPSLPILKLI